MNFTRRQFMIIGAAVATGCNRESEEPSSSSATTTAPSTTIAPAEQSVDAGPVSAFPPEQISSAFRDQDFFVIHRDKRLFVLSAICTHKGCKVRVADDQSFYCKCHGSTFDRDGKVTEGPATRSLPQLQVTQDASGRLLVKK